MALKTNYKDDILDTSANAQRKYIMIDNGDNTVSFVDETVYLQNGDSFGANDINQITKKLSSELLDSLEEIEANTDSGKIAGALAVKEINNNLGGLSFEQDAEGNWGYRPSGADAVIPFKRSLESSNFLIERKLGISNNLSYSEITLESATSAMVIVLGQSYTGMFYTTIGLDVDESSNIKSCDLLLESRDNNTNGNACHIYNVTLDGGGTIATYLRNSSENIGANSSLTTIVLY